ncbi:MAG: VOC family protein [Gammaproteobacteria bacterium]|nr:VOC family protein [Gammaproteobacteria bacterium]
MQLTHIDHLVLTVADIEATCRFYTAVLGMKLIEYGNNRKALAFGVQKINLHAMADNIQPAAQHPTPGSTDLCVISTCPATEIIAQLKKRNITIVAGPITRHGAQGMMQSVYINDPDNNLIEIAHYN